MCFSSAVFTIFIHCAAAELTGIFSDIMDLKDCAGFSDSLVLQQPVKTGSGGYLGHGREGIGGKELWLRLSEVQVEPRHGGERD